MEIKNKKSNCNRRVRGEGSSITEMLLSNGATVCCVDNNEKTLAKLIEANELYSNKLKTYPIDVTNNKSIISTVNSFYDEFGEVDILINNSAILDDCLLVNIFGGKINKHPIDRWNKTLQTNLTSYFVFTREVVEKMLLNRTKGLVIYKFYFIIGNFGQSSYSSSKAAVDSLTVTWANELSNFGIRVAGILPGMTDTSMPKNSMSSSQIKEWISKTPMKRMGQPSEIAHSVEYIISNDFLGGRTIQIDGGLRM